MHAAQSRRVGQVSLCQRQVVTALFDEPDHLQPREQLAEKMGEALDGGAPADVDEPLARRGRIHERDHAQGPGEGRALQQIVNRVRRDPHHLAGRQRRDVVIRVGHESRVEVAEVARQEIGHDLALAGRPEFVAASDAVQDQDHAGRRLALPDEVGTGGDGLRPGTDPAQHGLVGLRQRSEAFELAHEGHTHVCVVTCHDRGSTFSAWAAIPLVTSITSRCQGGFGKRDASDRFNAGEGQHKGVLFLGAVANKAFGAITNTCLGLPKS